MKEQNEGLLLNEADLAREFPNVFDGSLSDYDYQSKKAPKKKNTACWQPGIIFSTKGLRKHWKN